MWLQLICVFFSSFIVFTSTNVSILRYDYSLLHTIVLGIFSPNLKEFFGIRFLTRDSETTHQTHKTKHTKRNRHLLTTLLQVIAYAYTSQCCATRTQLFSIKKYSPEWQIRVFSSADEQETGTTQKNIHNEQNELNIF